MSWNYDRSLERIRKHLDGMGPIEIEKLVREADLESLLTETKCREIFGAHVYVAISNFARLASDSIYAEDDYKRLIQGVHIYQREVNRLVRDTNLFDGLSVHFQGPKLHALLYRPIDDAQELAIRAELLQLVLRDFVKTVFNPAFPDYDNFSISGGADLGDAIGTRNGTKGDRELLFLGAPANRAAKIIRAVGVLRITDTVYDELPTRLRNLCTPIANGSDYRVQPIDPDDLDDLLDEFGFTWDRTKSEERIKEDRKAFPLKDIAYSSAYELIDLDSLSIFNNKRVEAASIFADVSGFTAYVDAADGADGQRRALRVFHAIRKEMARVVRDDFSGLRIQFQGDRVQGLFHLPKDDATAIATKAVEAAAGLQSSMELTIKELLPEAESLSLAIGIDFGTTLVSKLGTRAHRDRICLGTAVEDAAECEERTSGGQIGISQVVYDALPKRLQKLFTFDEAAECYVATDLTAEKLERSVKADSLYGTGQGQVFIRSGAAGASISAQETPGARPVVPSKTYAEG